jgi:Fe-S cluster assembly scaffold protein SufB
MFFKGVTEASAKGARGHIDCSEIIIGKALAESVPIIKVSHPEARITHEASIGKVNQKELETLMTRGLSEKEAIDFIVKGRIK